MSRIFMCGTSALLAAVLGATPALAKNSNPGVAPPNSSSHGKTYGEWGAEWQLWSTDPDSGLPAADTTGEACNNNQSGSVFFLAGTYGTAEVRECTIPTGNAIFFPVMTILCWSPEDSDYFGSLEACIDFYMTYATEAEVEVDGVPLVDVLEDYQARSPQFTLPGENGAFSFGLSDMDRPSQADGIWVMLNPLSAGDHTIHFRGVFDITPWDFVFETEVTYLLTVAGGNN